MRNNSFAFILFIIVAFGMLSTGCRDIRSFKEVEKAFENPTGKLDDSTAPTVFNVSLQGQKSASANQFAATHSRVPGEVGTAVDYLFPEEGEFVSAKQALFGECSPHVEFTNNFQVEKIIFDCGDTGSITGSLVLELKWKNDNLEGFYVDYNMFCDSNTCLDGSMGITWSVDGASGSGLKTILLATARFDVITENQTHSVDWAWRIQQGEDESRFEWLVWTSPDRKGKSYVLSAVVSINGGYLEVRDAEGWWRCEYTEGVESGICFRCVHDADTCVQQAGGSTFSWETK